MKPSKILRFEFAPAPDAVECCNGWGAGTLWIQGVPCWYANSDIEPWPIKWTWVDLLEQLAANWSSLTLEQSYPFVWLAEAPHPGDIWTVAERRWARLGDEVANAEEPAVLEFERRHNLASAWKGMSLPSVVWLRNGDLVWICVEGRPPVRAPFDECLSVLRGIGDTLAYAFSASDNPRVKAAVQRWQAKGAQVKTSFIGTVTGLPAESLKAIAGTQDEFEYWEIAANSPWETGQVAEGELLAAARMTAGVLSPNEIADIIAFLKKLRRGKLDELNALSTAVVGKVLRAALPFAFQAGYLAAELVRDKLQRGNTKRFEVGDVLQSLGVEVLNVTFSTEKIDAIAVWGSRGPCVLLNAQRKHANSEERTRMTLAHELAHLVIDRKGGLPFCEVLGGLVDEYMEQRANAFAAELLLPRSLVDYEWTIWKGSFGNFLQALNELYGVSKSVACAQIFNSSIFDRLDQEAQEGVEVRLSREDQIRSGRAVRVDAAGDVA
jgi:Zn-dependent peptidase ImmA (M78 family)